MTSPSRGRGGRIAFFWPSDGLNEDEFRSFLPDGVALLTTLYAVSGELTTDSLEDDADLAPLVDAARRLPAAGVDVAALGDCAGSFILGREHERAMARAVAVELDRPATTMSGAIVAALRAFGARRVALAAPYAPEVVERLVAYLDEWGVEVTRHRGLDRPRETEIDALTPDDWHRAARAIASPAAEAIVLGGGGVRSAARLPAMEADLGVPVLAGPGALIWHACRLMGADATLSGRGRLFAEHGAEPVGP